MMSREPRDWVLIKYFLLVSTLISGISLLIISLVSRVLNVLRSFCLSFKFYVLFFLTFTRFVIIPRNFFHLLSLSYFFFILLLYLLFFQPNY